MTGHKPKIKLHLFFTWDVSMALWKKKGLLEREVRLYQALADKNIDVTFLTWGGKEDESIATEIKDIKIVPLYKYIQRPDNKILRCLFSFLVPFKIRHILLEADILKTNQMWGGWYAALSSLLCRKPLIVRCGYELYDFTVRERHNPFRKSFVWLISWFTYKLAHHICVATGVDKGFVATEFNIKQEKISVHPNWIDVNVFKPMQVPVLKERVLYVGRLSVQKNIKQLIEAMAGMPWGLDIVGGGELEEDLKNLVKDLGADVKFLGTQPNDSLPVFYNQYPVFVLPSSYEGNPKALLEAMACGRAVLGTKVPGIVNVIDHEKNGLLCDAHVESIREALKRLMGDPYLRLRLGQEAREKIVSTQSLDILVDKELSLYRELAS